MKRVLKSRLFILAAFAVVAAGCGGGGSNPVPSANGGVNFEGTPAVGASASEDAVIPATGGTTVTTSEGEVVVPSGSGAAVTTDTDLVILPAGLGFLGSFSADSTLRVNGVANSGVGLGSDGLTDQVVGLPATAAGTSYTLAFPGGTLDTSRALTVGEFTFSGKFYFGGGILSIPVPYALSGTLPQNGQNAVGAAINATFLGCNGRSATLTVTYGNGFVLQQTHVITNNQALFSNMTTDSSSVPAGGVQEVRLVVGDLP